MSPRKLTKDERELWRRAIKDVAPIGRESMPSGILPKGTRNQIETSGIAKPPKEWPGPRGAPDVFSAGDPRFDRNARRGRMPIDAVFDLHGHRQASARMSLYSFLIEAKARGHRCVLVITGKGAREVAGRQEGGVLRRRLRDWLKEDAFRQHIVRASPAHQRHGGEGAFYLFLKTSVRK